MITDTYGTYLVTYRVKSGLHQQESGPYSVQLQCDGSQASVEILTLEHAQLMHELPVSILVVSITKE